MNMILYVLTVDVPHMLTRGGKDMKVEIVTVARDTEWDGKFPAIFTNDFSGDNESTVLFVSKSIGMLLQTGTESSKLFKMETWTVCTEKDVWTYLDKDIVVTLRNT